MDAIAKFATVLRRMPPLSNKLKFAALLAALLLFRCLYGLSIEFWRDDEKQIYLLGLQWFTSGVWPLFGPDVIHTNQQIAGGLQSVLVGLPLMLTRTPEAPIIFVNLLSFLGLTVFAAYLCRQQRTLSPALIFAWIMTLPWTLNISAHVYNPSYLLFSSCLFFVAFAETIPAMTTKLISAKWAYMLMGFAVGWSFQLHLSWPLLLPFIGASLLISWIHGKFPIVPVAFLALGCALPMLLIIPTMIKFGPQIVLAPLLSNSGNHGFNIENPVVILCRFLSFGAYEIPRFITDESSTRLPYIINHPWLIPTTIILCLVGTIQPLVFLYGIYKRSTPTAIKIVISLALIELFLAFAMSLRPPTARNYYIFFPVAIWAAVYGMSFLSSSIYFRRVAWALIAVSIIYHAQLGYSHFEQATYSENRAAVIHAIATKDYKKFGVRRPFSMK